MSAERLGLLLKRLSGRDAKPEPSEDLLREAIREYKTQPHTPELVTETWQARWQVWGERAGLSIVVPDFPDTQEGLAEREQKGDKPIYVPPELATQESRYLLAKIWPNVTSYSVQEGNPVTNEVDHLGWKYVEASVDAPHRNTQEADLRKMFASQGREEMTLTEYIIASQDSKLRTDRFFDEGATWSRLLGSRSMGGVVRALFGSDGRLRVYWGLAPQDSGPGLGGRSSVGVQRA